MKTYKRSKFYIITHFFRSQFDGSWWMKYDDDRPNKFYGDYVYVPLYVQKYMNKWGEVKFCKTMNDSKNIQVEYTEDEVKFLIKKAMNMGMTIRQNQLQGYSSKSGAEYLDEWFRVIKNRKKSDLDITV